MTEYLVTVSLSESKQNYIKAILKEMKIRGKVVMRTLAKLIGKLEAVLPGIHHIMVWQTLFMAITPVKNTALKKGGGNFDSMCILENNAQIQLLVVLA